eukprot:TRINITY_DN4843_c0_g1_i4.p1 TRINITY_DN4843_c0_g1~~TRINITY_DN4843_c0_g1_i4.p1  ORF type:complete len:743 (+),score=246.33 TRINITY_DN4843_c0_g1_i4:177-2405(+)
MDETIKIEIETLERNAKDSSTISSLLHTLRSFPFILSSHDLVSCFQSWRNSHFSFVQSILLEVFPRWHFALTLEEWKKEFEPLIPPLPSSLLALASALVVRDSGKDAEFVEETLIQEKKSKRFGRIQTSGGAKKDQEEIHLFVIEMFKQWSENKSANENGFVRACSLLDDEHDPVFCDDVIRALVSIPDRIASLAAQDESCVAVHMNTDEDQSLSPNIFCADIFKCMLQCDVSLSDSLVENIFIHATQRGCGDGILDTSFSFTPVKFARFKTYLADLSRHLKEDEPEKEEEEERNLHTTLDEEKSMIFMLKHLSGGIRSLNVRKFLISLNRSLFFSSFISYYVLHFVVQSGRKKLKTPFEMVETPERMMNRLWNGLVMHDIRTMESGFRCFIRGLRLCGDHTKAICHIASTMLHSLLSTWSHSEFVSSHSIDENNQLTWCLLMWMHWFGKECDECKKSINTRMRDVFEGVHVRMDHMDHTIRKMGMVVAKITSMIISPDHVVDFDENDLGEWSKIDYDENFFDQFDDYISSQKPEDSEQSYAKEEMIVENMDGTHKNVSNEDTYDASLFDKTGHRTISASFFRDRTLEDSHDDDFDDDDFDDVADDGERDKQIDGKLSKETRDDLLHFETMNEGDEVDAEDEFVPYDLDDDLSDLDEIKAPRYLRTCLKMLQDSQHPQDVSVGMKHFASVLEKDHDDLEEIVPDVADVILHAVNTMEEDEFDFNRHQALIKSNSSSSIVFTA